MDRGLDTRAGTVELAIPKLREDSCFPDWLLERRKRAEQALTSMVATCYLLGVSTRRMAKLVETLGITRLSKSQVPVMAKDLDAQVEAFRTQPLDQGPYTFAAADALTMKLREGGRVVKVACLVATGVNADGQREILGLDACSTESHAGWLTFSATLLVRGRTGGFDIQRPDTRTVFYSRSGRPMEAPRRLAWVTQGRYVECRRHGSFLRRGSGGRARGLPCAWPTLLAEAVDLQLLLGGDSG